jgi:hypothetical protein
MDLAELFNAPTDLEFEGKTYRLRQLSQVERAEYQRWLEKRALDGILAETGVPEAVQDRMLRIYQRDKARGTYAWGSEVCCETVTGEEGLAKFLAIQLRDQGVDLETARRMAEKELKRIVVTLFKQETTDPKLVEAAERLLGLAGANSSSASPAPPSTPTPSASGG